MSLWVAQETIRRGLCLLSRRSSWLHHSFPVASVRDSLPALCQVHTKTTASRQMNPSHTLISTVRCFSEEVPSRTQNLSPRIAEIIIGEDQSDQETTSRTTSLFTESLALCMSPSDVLDLTTKHSPTVKQISKCLSRMWVSTKTMSHEQLRYELQLMSEHPGFDKLLQRAMQDVGLMRNEELLYSLMGMVRLDVPQQTRVIHTFLRTCQKNLNEFDEKGLSLLASCIEHMESSPNVDALKKGLRLVVDSRLPGIKNVMALQVMMRVMGRDSPFDLKKKLEKKALSMVDQFSLPNAQYMLFTMATMDFYSKPLLEICSKRIKDEISGTPFNKLLKILQSCHQLHYRNLDLLNEISDYSTSMTDIWSNKQVILVLTELANLHFSPDVLLEAFAERVIAKPDVLTLQEVLSILKVYSTLNYDRPNQKQLLESISQALVPYLPNIAKFKLVKASYHMCQLGHFPPAVLEHLLLEIPPEQLTVKDPKLLPHQEKLFQALSLCLRLDRPPLPQPLTVPPALIGDFNPASLTSAKWLSRSLRTVLGDQAETMLQEMVVEEDFCIIDAVITKPLANQDSDADVCSPSESSQRVAVICSANAGFCYGTSKPRGVLAMKIRHLKILGYEPIVVNAKQLASLTEQERVKLLREQIFPEHQSSDSSAKQEPEGHVKD